MIFFLRTAVDWSRGPAKVVMQEGFRARSMKLEFQWHDGYPRSLSLARAMPCVGLFLLQGLAAEGAAFQNLDFQSSPWFPPGDYNHPFTVYPNALPGWTVHIGNTVQDGACANEYILDAPVVSLMTMGHPGSPFGEKSVYMQSVALSNSLFPPSRV